jgi:hypothetical protein
MHIDFEMTDLWAETSRLEGVGAARTDQDPFEENGYRWVVMTDPDGTSSVCVPRARVAGASMGDRRDRRSQRACGCS